jgi:hypothetical protein
MASHDRPEQGPAAGRLALEAVRLGEMLDANHPADPGGLQSIGTCRTCGYLIFEAHGRTWRHLPSVEERDVAGRWLATHQRKQPAPASPSPEG